MQGLSWWLATLVACALVLLVTAIGPLLIRGSAAAVAKRLPLALSLAIGVLLGDVFLHLLPHAWEDLGSNSTVLLTACGFGLFATLSALLRQTSAHRHRAMAPLSLWGDAVHNTGDGALIALAFATSPLLGIATVAAILAHELPQELGDYAMLLESGLEPSQAMFWNLASGSTVFVGALAGLLLGSAAHLYLSWLQPVAAGGFLYLALFVLLPTVRRALPSSSLARAWRVAPALLGVAAMASLAFAEKRLGLDHGHVHIVEPPAETRNFAPWGPR